MEEAAKFILEKLTQYLLYHIYIKQKILALTDLLSKYRHFSFDQQERRRVKFLMYLVLPWSKIAVKSLLRFRSKFYAI